MLRLQYRHGPRLHGGLFSVHTRLGVALGGSLEADADSSSTPSTSSRSCSFVFTDSDAEAAETPSRRRKLSKASRKDALRRSLNIRPVPQVAGPPANSAGDTATGGQLTDEEERARYRAYLQQKASGPFDHIFIDYMTSESEWRSFVQVEKNWAEAGYASGYLTWATSAQDTAALTTHEGLEPSTSTSSSSGQTPPCSRCSHRHEERPCSKRLAQDTVPQPPQKQSSTKPLDTQPLLLPAHPSTYVEVEGGLDSQLCCRASETLSQRSYDSQLCCRTSETTPGTDSLHER